MDLPKHRSTLRETKKRTINGVIMDVSAAAAFLGATERTIRALVERRLIPFRRLNSRIIFIKTELEECIHSLPGCNVAEAQANRERRGYRNE